MSPYLHQPVDSIIIYLTWWYNLSRGKTFRTQTFSRWMQKIGLTDEVLCRAVSEMTHGLIDAELGGCILKKRMPLPGLGKRGGARTIVATKLTGHWFFLYGFGKNERANISREELKLLQEVAKELLEFDDDQLAIALAAGEILEVHNDGNETQEPYSG
ncbi:MAG: type II toxin-antitoxin system RelE/ParE family toxin [Alcaligenaceae bacterium]|nr:type II toxin-antitoxin system RelE/ParE family toxin [Alcaligenaceae bacterium]